MISGGLAGAEMVLNCFKEILDFIKLITLWVIPTLKNLLKKYVEIVDSKVSGEETLAAIAMLVILARHIFVFMDIFGPLAAALEGATLGVLIFIAIKLVLVIFLIYVILNLIISSS